MDAENNVVIKRDVELDANDEEDSTEKEEDVNRKSWTKWFTFI